MAAAFLRRSLLSFSAAAHQHAAAPKNISNSLFPSFLCLFFSLSRALVCTRIVLYFAGCVGAGALSSFAAHALAFVRVLHARRRVKIAFSFLTSSLTLLVFEKDVFK